MSEKILKALIQLFAIIAKVDEFKDKESLEEIQSSNGRLIVELFLKQELNAALVNTYLSLFDSSIKTYHATVKKKDGKRKRTSVNSVKVLRICSEINEELTQRQKTILLVRLIEFINANKTITEQELEFVSTVAESFNIENEEYLRIKSFIEFPEEVDSNLTLYLTSNKNNLYKKAKHLHVDGLDESISILHIKSVNIFFLYYSGKDVLTLNGQVVSNDRQHIFNQGSSFKTPKIQTIYYSDIITHFLSDKGTEKLTFHCDNVSYKFNNGNTGLEQISFKENQGKLIGIMGGSGTGKSTLLNVLNGTLIPNKGEVTINGINIHKEKEKIEGVIGFVSQDDLLIEELTIFQNIYFNAKLCFKELNKKQINKRVLQLLKSIGLFESRNLKVGTPLDKTISGGQRKRLNIALELIREPSVLFVDEPTSGLSSRDSENIMDLLKELVLKGKLIYVVIHQPSSDIFKMFDKLLLLDKGGYPIYYGNPVDGVVYFKTTINHVNCKERECETCGNVNPEQLFNIIEAKVVDEYGNLTSHRKTSPKEWHNKYLALKNPITAETHYNKPNVSFKVPSKLNQFLVFLRRDILSKFANKQYILINALEAPVLALLLSFFVKFFNHSSEKNNRFIFEENQNLPQYLFIAVVVALFMGLTVASEEIIKDKKNLKRESFLNLSKGSYLFSKIFIMFLLSGIQMGFFVFIGNAILEIENMCAEYWMILYSTACFANLVGLNISATLNSPKVIYILIPVIIIPQLLFSGVIVKFDKLHPIFAKENSVPWIGNIMVSRWAYEALAVTQFKHNEFESTIFKLNSQISTASWKRDYWIPELRNKLDILKNETKYEKQEISNAVLVLKNEIEKEERLYDPKNFSCVNCVSNLNQNIISEETNRTIDNFLEVLRKQYNADAKAGMQALKKKINVYGKQLHLSKKEVHSNKALTNLVTNRNNFDKIVEKSGELIQKKDPIYLSPIHQNIFTSHFYAPNKKIGKRMVDTFVANLIVIWSMTFILVVTLFFDFFKKIIFIFRLKKV